MKRLTIILFWSVAVGGQAKQPRELKPLPTLTQTIEWLTGASEEEAGWGGGGFQFSKGDSKCSAEISTSEILETHSEKDVRRSKYSFRLADIDPSDIRFELIPAKPSFNVIQFHTYNYKKTISFTKYKDAVADWSDKEVEFTDTVRTPFTSDLRTNDWFAPRFVKAFKRAVELCGGRSSSY
jgi:hypothetical protein